MLLLKTCKEKAVVILTAINVGTMETEEVSSVENTILEEMEEGEPPASTSQSKRSGAVNDGIQQQEGSAPDKDNEEVVMMFERDAHGESELLSGPAEYVERDITGGKQEEPPTTQTTKALKPKRATVPFDSHQWTALATSIFLVALSVGWQIQDRLPQFASLTPFPMLLGTYDKYDPKSQATDISILLNNLTRSWKTSSQDVKEEFIKAYMPEGATEALAAAKAGKQPRHVSLGQGEIVNEDDLPFALLGDTAKMLSSAQPPLAPLGKKALDALEDGDKGEEVCLKQLMFTKAMLKATYERLGRLKRKESRGATENRASSLPSMEELQRPTIDLIDTTGFLRMLRQQQNLLPFQAPSASGIPRALAEELALLLTGIHRENASSAEVYNAFTEFVKQLKDEKETASEDLKLIGSRQKFPATLFVEVLEETQRLRQAVRSELASLGECMESWDIEHVMKAYEEIKASHQRIGEQMDKLLADALEKACNAGYCKAGDPSLFSYAIRLL